MKIFIYLRPNTRDFGRLPYISDTKVGKNSSKILLFKFKYVKEKLKILVLNFNKSLTS